MKRGTIENLEHNLLARLGNAAACLRLDDAYTALEYLRDTARAQGVQEVEIEVLSGVTSLPESADREKVIEDLREQLRIQTERLGLTEPVAACRLRIAFHGGSEEKVAINRGPESAAGSCELSFANS